MGALVLLVLVQRGRPGAHQAHIAPEDIEELGQLVDTGLADELAHLGDAGIVLHLEHEAVHFVPGHQLFLPLLRVHIHTAELVDIEHTAVAAHTALFEDQRAGAFQLEGDGHDGNDGDAEDAAHQTAHNVQHPLEGLVAEFELHGAHGDHIATGAAAQAAAQAGGAGLIAADILDAVQQGQTEMDGQSHALHLFQIRHKGITAVHGDVHIHFIQRGLPQPVHKGIVVGLDVHALDLAADLLFRDLQQGNARQPLGPVPLQLPHHFPGIFAGGHNAHQAFHAVFLPGGGQQLFEHTVEHRHQHHVDNRHCHQKIPGAQQRGLGQQQARRVDEGQDQVKFDRDLQLPFPWTGGNVLALVKGQKRQQIGQHQQAERLDEVGRGVVSHLAQQTIHHQPAQRYAEGQREDVCYKSADILQFFSLGNHDFSIPSSFTIIFPKRGTIPVSAKSPVRQGQRGALQASAGLYGPSMVDFITLSRMFQSQNFSFRLFS